MMIVFLRGVRSASQLGALGKSIWDTRAWTLQEYITAKIIHFYTGDWIFYLDLGLPNHKESPEVILEMEQATGVSAQQLMASSGLTSILVSHRPDRRPWWKTLHIHCSASSR